MLFRSDEAAEIMRAGPAMQQREMTVWSIFSRVIDRSEVCCKMNGVQGMHVGVCVPRGMLRARAGQPQQACQAAATAEGSSVSP